MEKVEFPQFQNLSTFIGYYENVNSQTLAEIKNQLIKNNPTYNFCFLATTHLISREQILCAVHKALQNHVNGRMKAKTVHTEIIFNLSPVNNINDALKRFGVDEHRDDVIVIHVGGMDGPDTQDSIESRVSEILGVEASPLEDSTLVQRFDEKKFVKLFKLNDTEKSHNSLSQGALTAALLRGL